jgi:hypothetical protein
MNTKTIGALILILTATAANAATIIAPTVTADGTPQSGVLSQITDGTGLSSSLITGDIYVPGTLPTHASGGTYGADKVRWFLFNATHPTEMIFDLGESYAEVDNLILYNYTELADRYYPERGFGSVTASYSNGGSYFGAETLTFSAAADAAIAGEVISINQTNIRYVKFTDITSLGAGDVVGLSEVRFTGVVPEPGTYALIGGLLALSCVMVRRRR